ncbi:MAG TPA: hypothetical protein VE573_15690 [Nitrososphaeraceae archaeon]|jgi:hypothetical protein|nr:hypothetical protein [Nitrososphaeraceae archaeon]
MGLTLMDLRQYHDAITYFDKVINITNETNSTWLHGTLNDFASYK